MDKISQIKNYFNIAAVVAPYTHGLIKFPETNYPHYMNGWCPFCQNGTPQRGKSRRFWVNVDNGLCNCFYPKCKAQYPMDVINFMSRIWGISNAEAINDLHEDIKATTRIK